MAGLFLMTLAFLVLIGTLIFIPSFDNLSLQHAASGGQAVVLSPSEFHWKMMAPETPIPSIILDLMTSSVENTFSLKSRNISPLDRFIYNVPGVPFVPDHDDPNKGDFLLQRDLRPGTTMTLHLQRTIDHTGFLPRQKAKSIPFSSADLPAILARFNVKPGSPESDTVEEILHVCESEGMRGERKHCATSVESMIDFAATTVGTSHLTAISTRPAAEPPAAIRKQEYTIAWPGARLVAGGSSKYVACCHPVTYPYAVYYCHSIENTNVYEVPVVGKEDGSRVTAVAACHSDTTQWDPMHPAFQVLGVKPGTLPICHFIAQDEVFFAADDASILIKQVRSS